MTPLDRSIDGLRHQSPELSAHHTLSRRQGWIGATALGLILLGLLIKPVPVLTVLLGLTTALYLLNLGFRLTLFRRALRAPTLVRVSDVEASALDDETLPTYTVLVPVYHEASVVPRTVKALEAIDYPRTRLDIKLILEADDVETAVAAEQAIAGSTLPFELIRVPASAPRTKPKACNYGLQRARGDLITIFDAEDRPEPLQLRRAVAAFRRLPSRVACLQAKLSYHNARQNLLTRWFTAEYEAWFALMLPALADGGGPVPLGGTSMHIKRRVLLRVGGWDPYNVTEDADLGVRLQRLGYQVKVLDSTTMEEANSDFVNWVKQRSRWYKGYLQTWLVHMRHPFRLWRELGPRGFVGLSLMVGAIPVLALVNPVFWGLTVLWLISRSPFMDAVLPPVIYFPGLVSLLLGTFSAFTSAWSRSGHPTVPIYCWPSCCRRCTG